jgi:hypothetical protein
VKLLAKQTLGTAMLRHVNSKAVAPNTKRKTVAKERRRFGQLCHAVKVPFRSQLRA